MTFHSREEVMNFICTLIHLGDGSQGVCYVDKNFRKVYKFYRSYLEFDDILYTKEEILQFKDIKSSTFLFPEEVILLNDEVIGDVTPYRNAKNLCSLNPLNIRLDRLIKLLVIALKEIEYISRSGVNSFDVMYNILLGNKFYFVDTLDYSINDRDYKAILSDNMKYFNLGIMYFLVDGLFDGIVSQNAKLKEMYDLKGRDISILEFTVELKKYLSEILGHEITYLREARDLRDQDVVEYHLKYDRDAMLRERIINIRE